MLSADWQNQVKKVSRLIAKAWLDPEVLQRLESDPITVLQEYQIQLPTGVKVELNRATDTWQIVPTPDGDGAIFKIPLSSKPDDILDEELRAWSEGDTDIAPDHILKKS